MTIKAFAQKQEKKTKLRFFSSLAIKKTIELLLKDQNKQALRYLLLGRTYFAQKFLERKKHHALSAVLLAFDDTKQAIQKIEKLLKSDSKNNWLWVELAYLYFISGNHNRAVELLAKVDDKKSGRYTFAKKAYLVANFDVLEGNLQPASDNSAFAAKLFDKENASVEEAESFILLGTIYRLSALTDLSQMMFESALKIYTEVGSQGGIADANGNIGMLMVLQERLDEALDYFNKSLATNLKLKRNHAYADVLNQIGLLYLIDKDFEKAGIKALEAYALHKTSGNEQGQAFSQDILSQIDYGTCDYTKALQEAEIAEKLYKKIHNMSAYFESLYIQAQIMFDEENFDVSEDLLRRIIEEAKGESTSFHVANAYNLLGLIFMKRGELPRAKSLFQQSLSLEQKNDRVSGIAVDYANMGLIEKKLGNKDEAQKNLTTALEYACLYGETELSCLIKERIEKLSDR